MLITAYSNEGRRLFLLYKYAEGNLKWKGNFNENHFLLLMFSNSGME